MRNSPHKNNINLVFFFANYQLLQTKTVSSIGSFFNRDIMTAGKYEGKCFTLRSN